MVLVVLFTVDESHLVLPSLELLSLNVKWVEVPYVRASR